MTDRLQARSISRAVAGRLPSSPAAGQVLAVFERACLIVPTIAPGAPHREPVALVVPEIGDGPLNVVVDREAGPFAGIEPGAAAGVARNEIHAGPLIVDVTQARSWEPRPDWESLRASWPQALRRLELVRNAALNAAPAGSLLALLDGGARWHPERRQTLLIARQAAEALAAGWAGDGQALVRGARHLAGLGNGLTPAGDDLLAGFMLRAWLGHPRPADLCHDIVSVAAPRTTTLAAAFLRAAARGECDPAWQLLLYSFVDRHKRGSVDVLTPVLTHGCTSGADMLAGFLWEPRDLILSRE